MPDMLERIFKRHKKDDEPVKQEYPDFAYRRDFSAAAFRSMEDTYIRLGYMTEDERTPLPSEVEFPEQSAAP
ncbi:hypothetical protein [Mycobacteroides abscessus]|nr:hypothetical protein [Mycobacteroides abscessus]